MKRKKGFTIIEVTLVLALAGLIFVGVFIALPALTKARKNNARLDHLAAIMQALEDYEMNNNGASPFRDEDDNTYLVLDDFVQKYVVDCEPSGDDLSSIRTGSSNKYELQYTSCNKDFRDPDGVPYKYKLVRFNDLTSSQQNSLNNNTPVDITNKLGFKGHPTYNGNMDYVFYGFEGGECGDEGMLASHGDERYTAVFYILDGGEITCLDNH